MLAEADRTNDYEDIMQMSIGMLSVSKILIEEGGDVQSLLKYSKFIVDELLTREKFIGSEGLSEVCHLMAITYSCVGDYDQAFEWYVLTINAYEKYGSIEENRYYELIDEYFYFCAMYKKELQKGFQQFFILKTQSVNTAAELVFLADKFTSSKNYQRAFYYYIRAIAIYSQQLGEMDVMVGRVYYKLGVKHYEEGSFEYAKICFQKASNILAENLGEENEEVLLVDSYLKEIE